jgi:hypothetical protein
MIYRLIYNNNSLSCTLYDPEVVYDFAGYMVTKNWYPIAVLKIKLK